VERSDGEKAKAARAELGEKAKADSNLRKHGTFTRCIHFA